MEQYENRTSKWMKSQAKLKGGMYTDRIAEPKKKQQILKEQPIIEEGKIRRKIQLFIIKKVALGYPPDQLLKRLNFVFGTSKYAPYKKYYKTWIMNALEKQISIEERDDEQVR